jgi:hypothetical protein
MKTYGGVNWTNQRFLYVLLYHRGCAMENFWYHPALGELDPWIGYGLMDMYKPAPHHRSFLWFAKCQIANCLKNNVKFLPGKGGVYIVGACLPPFSVLLKHPWPPFDLKIIEIFRAAHFCAVPKGCWEGAKSPITTVHDDPFFFNLSTEYRNWWSRFVLVKAYLTCPD